jgi:hypothetical protein
MTHPISQIPEVTHPVNEDRTEVAAVVEHIEGEVQLDSYVKAQCSAPQVVARITELENCLQRLATGVFQVTNELPGTRAVYDLRTIAEEAKLLLKNRLEVDDAKHRFHSQLGRLL